MAGIKISALPVIPVAPALTDIYPTVQGGVTYQATIAQLATLLGFGGSPAILAMANGGTNAALVAANGAIPYSTASAMAFLAPGTAGQLVRSGGAGAPTWTTTTYPATNAINTIMYASSANVLDVIAAANSAVLISSAGGVPSMSTVLPGGLTTTDPVLAQGIATKNYVDQTALNGTSVYAASAATLGTVTQSGAGVGATLTNAGVQATFALDGVNPPVGSNVLIKNTATGMAAANEGIYTVTDVGSGATNWVLTRASDYDTPTEINNTGLIVVVNGSSLAGTTWYNTSTIVTVDTTAFSYSQFGANFLSNALSSANIFVGNGSNIATGVAMSGDVHIDNTGATTIQNSAVSNAKLANMADQTIKGNVSGGAAAPSDLTKAQVLTMLGGGTYLGTTIYTSGTNTFTPNSLTSKCLVTVIGGGGGGGGVAGGGGGTVGAGGGGSGGIAIAILTKAQMIGAGTTTQAVVGALGAGGTSGANTGSTGGTSTLKDNGGAGSTLISCAGGVGGLGGTVSVTAQLIAGGAAGAVTISTGTQILISGQSGFNGLALGSVASGQTGRGGSTPYGNGGGGGTSTGGAGLTASGSGSGGGGAFSSTASSFAGGDGTAGLIRIDEYS